jgi:phosphomannomutase/phosphoglucomutase
MKHIFREYDIRGIVDNDLNPQVARKLGLAMACFFDQKGWRNGLVGGDVRLSTSALQAALIESLRDGGMNVTDLGTCPTPAQYFALVKLDADFAVQVTGSHNPPQFNGFKITDRDGSVFGEDIQKIYALFSATTFSDRKPGHLSTYNILPEYIDAVVAGLRIERPLKIVLDAGNGAAGLVLKEVFAKLPVEADFIYNDPDGNFPNHHPDPTVEENLSGLRQRVKELGADLGIGFDGDADRLGVIDANGDVVWGDKLMILFARDVIAEAGSVPIIFDVKCSQALAEEIRKAGGEPIMWKTGHSLIKAKMKESGALLAGEMSGHIFFKHRYFGYDDAVYAAARLCEILSKSGKALHEHLENISTYFTTPEIRQDCGDDARKFAIMKRAKEYFSEHYETLDVDGVRILFADGWALIRASNTQPVLVLRYEATSEAALERIQNEVNITLYQWESENLY